MKTTSQQEDQIDELPRNEQLWFIRTLAELDGKVVLNEWRKARKLDYFNALPIYDYVEKKLLEAYQRGQRS